MSLDDGLESVLNNSTTPLGPGEVFTGLPEDISRASMITVFAFSDVDSEFNGLSLEFSTDGQNWDRTKKNSVVGNDSSAHSLVSISRFFRVVYTNGSVAQTTFRLQTIFNRYKSKGLTSSTGQTLTPDLDVELVRTVSTTAMDIGRGLVAGQDFVPVFGFNGSVGAIAEEVWPHGGDYTGFLTADSQLEVLSDSALDSSAGTGARLVIIDGLVSAGCTPLTEIVVTDGTTPVLTAATNWRRINRMSVSSVGTYAGGASPSTIGANIGKITARVAGGGAVVAVVGPDCGLSQQAVYTVPENRRALIRRMLINVSNPMVSKADVDLWIRPSLGTVAPPVNTKFNVAHYVGLTGFNVFEVDFLGAMDAKSDIWFSAAAPTGPAPAVTAFLELLVVPLTPPPPPLP